MQVSRRLLRAALGRLSGPVYELHRTDTALLSCSSRCFCASEGVPRITKVLVANRGAIAARIFRTARKMGLRTVAVFSDEDAGAYHTRFADDSYYIVRSRSPRLMESRAKRGCTQCVLLQIWPSSLWLWRCVCAGACVRHLSRCPGFGATVDYFRHFFGSWIQSCPPLKFIVYAPRKTCGAVVPRKLLSRGSCAAAGPLP